jgi:hypothetical protein
MLLYPTLGRYRRDEKVAPVNTAHCAASDTVPLCTHAHTHTHTQVHVVQSQATERLPARVGHDRREVLSVQHTNGIGTANDIALRSRFCAAAVV